MGIRDDGYTEGGAMTNPSVAPVLVGVDGSAESKKALQWAANYAASTDSPLVALIAWDEPVNYGMPGLYADVDFEARARGILTHTVIDALGGADRVELRTGKGHAAAVLVAASERARLLVIGQHGHRGFAGSLLGSVSQHCVHHAQCPVTVIRGNGHD
jgi:nucleotide-binding universal stress UspA family protein